MNTKTESESSKKMGSPDRLSTKAYVSFVYVARYLVASILCTVAILQNFNAHTVRLTSWKGGGFGLFASHDQMRFAKIYGVTSEKLVAPVSVAPKNLHVLRFLAVPSTSRGDETAAILLESNDNLSGGRVEVAAFDIDYDVRTSVMSCRVLATGDSRRKPNF